MSRADRAHPLLDNFRSTGFWNPTRIPANELDVHMHRMDLNECPYPPSPQVIEAIGQAALGLNRYPDGTCPTLTARLASDIGVMPEQICYGSGSTQLLTCIAQISIGSGDELVAPELIWRRFSGIFKAVDANCRLVPNTASGAIDVDALVGAIGNATRLAIVLTPNNPTGMMLSATELSRIARGVPENVLLFVDEAYFEFARHAGGPDAVEVLKDRRGPWVVTRTFSKAYALAGLRLGYAICSDTEVANALRLVTSTFNLTGVAEKAVLAALDDPDYTRMILDTTALERRRIVDGVGTMGLNVMESVTNFVGVDVGRDAGEVVAEMRKRGVRISTFGYKSSGTFIRVSTGLPEDTDAFLSNLSEVLQ
jgi:histidinol-phosphate aminotransferase